MTIWQCENNRFDLCIYAQGAELCSLWDKQLRREWLWQPQPGVWANSATQLFPVVGRLIHDGLWHDGRFFPLPAHGFLRHQLFSCMEQTPQSLMLEASATDKTLAVWPWRWRVRVSWQLSEEGLSFSQQVFNDDNQPMLFSSGWHPGFALPVSSQPGWRIVFADGDVNGPFFTRDRTLSLPDIVRATDHFPLHDACFRQGAVYFAPGQHSVVQVCSPAGKRVITLKSEAYSWLALWGVPGADLLCIEPLAGTTDAPDFTGNINLKRGIQRLAAGESRTFRVQLRFAVDA